MNQKNFLVGLYIFVSLALLIESVIAIKTQLLDVPEMLTSNDFSAYLPGSLILKNGLGEKLYDQTVFINYQNSFTYPFVHNRLVYRALPFVTLLYLPFAFFPYSTSFVLFTLFSLFLIHAITFAGGLLFSSSFAIYPI